jgi:methanogenic corrinoid protein MtbC1
MSQAASSPLPLKGIAAVERATGISKDTLRIWERRYGFPQPLRDAQGERLYPEEQMHRLRLLKRLVDAGHRPGRVVGASPDAIEALLQQVVPPGKQPAKSEPAAGNEGDLQRMLDLLRSHDSEGFQRSLTQTLMRLGLRHFVLDLVAPLTQRVGEEWMHGRLEIFEEHLYTESLKQVMRQAIHAMPHAAQAQRPRVLMSTLPGEQHALGLLMAEALLTLEGAQCVSLGVQTPVPDLILAAAAHRADIVALSFAGMLPAAAVQEGLRELRRGLPPSCEIWAGGSAAALRRRALAPLGLRLVANLQDIAAEIGRWAALDRPA